MSEVGYVKFQADHHRMDLAPFEGLEDLKQARRQLRSLGLVGVDENGVGFGNLSLRAGASTNEFYITGSGTGGKEELAASDFAKVTACDFDRNWLRCEGGSVASAESLTHAAVYTADGAARAVIHVHSAQTWSKFRGVLPTTREDAEYGTPAMAAEVQRLFRSGEVAQSRMFIMGGHENGLVAFGSRMDEALEVLLRAA